MQETLDLNRYSLQSRLSALLDPEINLLQNIISLAPLWLAQQRIFLFLINSAIHAFCGILVLTLLQKNFEIMPSVCGVIVFLYNPTQLEWTANLLKDGVFICGCLLCTRAIVGMKLKIKQNEKDFLFNCFSWSIGLIIIFKSRPYFLAILFLIGFLSFFVFIYKYIFDLFKIGLILDTKTLFQILLLAFLLLILPLWFFKQGEKLFLQIPSDTSFCFAKEVPNEVQFQPKKNVLSINGDLKWKKSFLVPDFIENAMLQISIRRQGFLNTSANSIVDANKKLQSASDFISYLPNAFFNGWFSPYPNTWFQAGSSEVHTLGRRILGFLSFFYWPLIFAGAFYFWEKRKQMHIFLISGISMVGVLFFGYAVPNIGALNRMRYGFYMLWIAFGTAYVTEYLLRRRS